jgi:hypothetical protein
MHTMQLHCFETKLPSLKLKTRPWQLLGSLPLAIAHSALKFNLGVKFYKEAFVPISHKFRKFS